MNITFNQVYMVIHVLILNLVAEKIILLNRTVGNNFMPCSVSCHEFIDLNLQGFPKILSIGNDTLKM